MLRSTSWQRGDGDDGRRTPDLLLERMRLMPPTFSALNASKANFDEIYVMPDPRGYFSVLGSLDYKIPDIAEPEGQRIALEP